MSDRTVKLASKNSLQWRQKYYIMHKWTSAVSLPFEMKKKRKSDCKINFFVVLLSDDISICHWKISLSPKVIDIVDAKIFGQMLNSINI